MGPRFAMRRLRSWAPLALALAGTAAAQTPPTPGAVIEGLENRRERAPAGPAEFIFQQDYSPSKLERNGRRFTVKGFHFVGNTVFTEARLRRVVERFVDLQLNLYDLNRAADAITRFYRDFGYPVAGAFVPVQKVTDGLVVIQVVEGHIGRLAFTGGSRYTEEFLAPYLAPVLGERQVTIGELERDMLLVNDLPGLQARVTLAPGAKQGDTDATVALEEKPLRATFQVNNSGRKEAGAQRYDVGLEWNNPLGIGDQLTWRVLRAERSLMHYDRVGYSLPIGADGLRLAAAASRVNYRIAGDFAALGIEGLVDSSEISLSYPLRRSRVSNIFLSGGVKSTLASQSALDTPLSRSRLTVANVGFAANWVHEDSSNTNVSAAYSSNFRNNYGNNPEALRGKLDFNADHLAGMSPHWDLFTRVSGMVGAGSVPDTEKFSIGGPDSVRGYRVSEYRGDVGALLTVEFRRQYAVAETAGVVSIFYDRGVVSNSGYAGRDALSSWGIGTTVFAGREARVRADVAWPSNRHVAGDGKTGPRLWLSASVSF